MTATPPTSTSSKLTRVLGASTLGLLAVFLLFALFISPPEVSQREAVRIFYIHVPSAIAALYIGFGITAFGGVMYLRKQSTFWDLLAASAAEIGVLFCAITLVSGALWGRPTWGTYWEWDPRLTSTTISFVLFLGYLAVRRLDIEPAARSRRAAVLGIIGFLNTIVVRYSVEWWQGLHQGTTLSPTDTQMDGLHLFSFFLGGLTIMAIFAWLLVHRFRVAWLEHQVTAQGLEHALAERRAEATEVTAASTAHSDGGNS